MSGYRGDFVLGATVGDFFDTNSAAGAAVAPSGAFGTDDIVIYRDGPSTKKATTNGVTVTSPADSITGHHWVSVDTSNNTGESAFWAAAHDYYITLNPNETVDSQTVVAEVFSFSIDNRGFLRPATAGRTLVVDASGLADANAVKVGPTGAGTAQTARDLGLALPAVAPGTANGLFIAGTNAPVTITGSGDALTLTSSGANGNAINATGNGTGAGLKVTGGATGPGLQALGGGSGGAGIVATANGGNANGITALGNGSGHGVLATGGTVSGDGLRAAGGGTGHGLNAQGGSGATGNGINAKSNATAGNGMALVKAGTGKNLDVATENEISNNLLDQVNTGATHNIANSVGRQIRTAGGGAPSSLLSGTVQAGSTANTVKLSTAASPTNNAYRGCLVVIDGGTPTTALSQTRTIISYNGTTKVATVDENWVVIPAATNTFSVYASANAITANEGTAQAGGPSSITLATTASAVDDYYANNSFVTILSGTGSGQTKTITAYNGTTKVATVDSAWGVQPSTDSVYAVIPFGATAPATTGTPAPSSAENASTLLSTAVNMRNLSAVTAPNVGDALNAALNQGAGDWALTGVTETTKNMDGTTGVVFTLDSATAPTSRTK